MADYNYVAVSKDGSRVKGSITADNKGKASDLLKAKGLLPTSIEDQTILTKEINIELFNKPKARDLSIFCRQFVSIIGAGVSIIEALTMLSQQTENKVLKRAISETKKSVETGESLAGSMRKNKKIFGEMFITIVEAGEASGDLEMAFSRMATQFEKETKLKGMIKKATIYPIAVAIVAVGVITVMLTYVIPTFEDMFEDLGTELPMITKMVVAASDFMIGKWYLILAGIIAIVVGLRFALKTEIGQMISGKIMMEIPLFGKLTVKTASSQFARTLSTLISSGLPMMDAIEITANTMTNYHFKKALLDTRNEVALGAPLSEPLERCKVFPPLVYHMVGIGEESGDIEGMLDKMADYYEEEVEMTTQSVMAAIEPMIIVVLAGIVGTIIISIILPMVSMYEGLDNL